MAEETEVKSTEEVKPQEPKSKEKAQEKKAPAKKKRPLNAKRKGAAPAAKKPAVFIEDGIKQKIKDAQNDPKVKAASKKFAAEK